MQATVRTVTFQGIDVLPIDVQVLVAPGTIAFAVVGLPDTRRMRHRASRAAYAKKHKSAALKYGDYLRVAINIAK